MRTKRITVLIVILLFVTILSTQAQMERKRATVVQPTETFWTPTLVSQATTEQINGGNLNVTIMHSFGIATTNSIQNFFGLDNIQNIRLGIDVGLTDKWSVGIGRSSLFNVVDLRTKYALIRQNTNGEHPFSITLKGDLGVVTQQNKRPFEDDISILASTIISKRINKHIRFQLSPMYGHFSTVATGNKNNLFTLGMGSQINLSDRYALIAEYYPVLGNENPGTYNAFSLGLNIQTGGHVFQMFFTSTRWHLEQYVMAQNQEQFWAGDFRFGFNVNRIFGL